MSETFLGLKELKFGDILRENAALASAMQRPSYDVRILSNIVVTQANEIFEYALRTSGVAAVVQSGDYDNVVQDTQKYAGSQLVIVFLELCNVIEGLQFEIELFDEAQTDAVYGKAVSEIQLIFEHLSRTPLVLFNRFTAIQFSSSDATIGRMEMLGERLNQFLDDHAPANVQLVDVEKLIARGGVKSSVDARYFAASKALYSIEFLKQYVAHTVPAILAVNGRLKKALILDCDETLWKGILGEDGESGIDMSAASRRGAIFAEAQSILLSWRQRGVLLGLCSKNNAADVDRVLATHPDMRIRDNSLVIKRVNWQDKVTNLREIARELQIGLDSLVLLDDSPFEAELVRSQLPEVKVLQVPSNLSEYPGMLRDHAGWFLAGQRSPEDLAKTEMYKSQVARADAQSGFSTIDEYLAALGIQIAVLIDDESAAVRLAQLSQKTNQFNLTTRRYTEAEVRDLIDRNDALVLGIQVSDRFGDSGIVGLCVVRVTPNQKAATVEAFLMSCRVLGRNIEFAFMNYLVAHLESRGVSTVEAKYLKTAKNDQVKDFYDRCSFTLVSDDLEQRAYSLPVGRYVPKAVAYLTVADERATGQGAQRH